MTIRADEYEKFRAWSATFIEQTLPGVAGLPADVHPLSVLDAMANRAPGKARQGLRLMIGDLLEATAHFPREEVARLDAIFGGMELPTLSAVRARFSKEMDRIVRSGRIRSEIEYYAVRNAVDDEPDDDKQQRLWELLEDYEQRARSD